MAARIGQLNSFSLQRKPLFPGRRVVGPFLPVVDFGNRNVQSVAEILGGVEDRQDLGLRPEVELVPQVATDMAVELVRRDANDEAARIVTACQGQRPRHRSPRW